MIKNIPSMWFIRYIVKLKYIKLLLAIARVLKKQCECINRCAERKTLYNLRKMDLEIKDMITNSPLKSTIGGGLGDRGEENRKTHR